MTRIKQNFSPNYNKISTFLLRQALVQNDKYYSSRKRGFARRLLCWLDRRSLTTDMVEYMDHVYELGLTTYRCEVSFLFEVCQVLAVPKNPFIEEYFYSRRSSQSTAVNEMILLSEIRDGLAKLEPSERWSLHMLGLTGMRSVDVTRMECCRELDDDMVFYCKLPYSKKRATLQIVEVRRDESEFTSDVDYDEMRSRFYNGEVSEINWGRIRRRTGLCLHRLRNRKAIFLLMKGMSQSEIMHRLGWCTESSLRRYSFLSSNILRRFKTVDEVVLFCRSEAVNEKN